VSDESQLKIGLGLGRDLTTPRFHRFQELDLSAQAFLLDNSVREDDWSKLIENSFKKRNLYKKVIFLLLFFS